MNNAKLWLTVKPTVGVPMFLGAVAIGSFAVHVAVLSNTTWVSDFLSGQELGSGASAAIEAPVMSAEADVKSILKSAVTGTEMSPQKMEILLPDGRKATVIISGEKSDPLKTASIQTPQKY